MFSCCKFLFSLFSFNACFLFCQTGYSVWRKKCVIVTFNRIIEDLFEESSVFCKGFVKNLVFFQTI